MQLLPHPASDWGTLETSYTDEFGPIAPDVYASAGRLWRQAQAFTSRTLASDGGPERASTLLLKAAAQVTSSRDEKTHQIHQLDGYLFKTFKRVVLAELAKDENRRRYETEAWLGSELGGMIENVERRILLEELVAAMDGWTREVFQLLTLGYSLKEIGRHVRMSERAVSNKYHRRIKSLLRRIGRMPASGE
jgi:DNA-directed RNA polymerase specialized sigma24 family protein